MGALWPSGDRADRRAEFSQRQDLCGYRNRPFQEEQMDGIRVIRVWTYIAANEGFLRRILDYMSFMVAAVAASRAVRRPDASSERLRSCSRRAGPGR